MSDNGKELQFVVSIIKAVNWADDGVWVVKLGLVDIGTVSPSQFSTGWGFLHYPTKRQKNGLPSRVAAACALIAENFKYYEEVKQNNV